MTKDKLQKIMEKTDTKKPPKHWNSFVTKNLVNHNLILKYGKKAFCTHCQKYFDKDVKMHAKEKCPFCGNSFLVRNHNIKNELFYKDVGFYCKVDGNVVLRVFEIESRYDYKTKTFKHDLQEFARFIPNVGIIINNCVSFFMWYQKVYHYRKITNWHKYTGKRVLDNMPIYPHNKKKLFKNTYLQYAPVEEFTRKFKTYTEFQAMQLGTFRSFELLWKMGLYNLSKCPQMFNKKGDFVKRFGISKSFLNFMVENDIDYNEYILLKILQKPDIDLIQKYRYFDYNYLIFMKKQGLLYDYDIVRKFYGYSSVLKEISKYVPIKKFLQYKKGVNNIHIYADYLKMATDLGISLKSKKRLFPYQLIAWHDKLSKRMVIVGDDITQFKVYTRFLELSKYIYKDDNYIIFPVPSFEDLVEEGTQQGNCVASYLSDYINKNTEIYLIRELSEPTKSFITLEYKNNRVAQKELPHHSRNFTKEQLDFIEKWKGHRTFADYREKYKTPAVHTNNLIRLAA